MVDFYHGVLGLPLTYPVSDENWFAVQAGDVEIFFFPGRGKNARLFGANGDENPPGLESIAWRVDDLDLAMTELDGKVTWGSDVITWTHPNGNWYRMRVMFDPEGNKVWLTEPHRQASNRHA